MLGPSVGADKWRFLPLEKAQPLSHREGLVLSCWLLHLWCGGTIRLTCVNCLHDSRRYWGRNQEAENRYIVRVLVWRAASRVVSAVARKLLCGSVPLRPRKTYQLHHPPLALIVNLPLRNFLRSFVLLLSLSKPLLVGRPEAESWGRWQWRRGLWFARA